LDVYVSGSYAYLATLDGFYVLDISNLQLPRKVGYYHIEGGASSVFVSGSYAYITGGYTLYILDVTNPQSPRRVVYINTPGYAYDVYVSGSYAYVACDSAGLRIIDISNLQSAR